MKKQVFDKREITLQDVHLETENEDVAEKEEDVALTEENIYSLKQVAKNNMLLNLFKHVSLLLIVLVLALPLINVNYILGEENLSFLNIFFSSSTAENFKGQLSASLGAEFFSVSLEDYDSFFSSMMTLGYHGQKMSAPFIIRNIIFSVAFVLFFVVLLKTIFSIIPCILNGNVEGSLRFATPNTLKKLPIRKVYEKEKSVINTTTKVIKIKGFKLEVIGWIILWGITNYFFFEILSFLAEIELVAVSPLLFILIILFSSSFIVLTVCSSYYSFKYSWTLYVLKNLKSVVK